MSKFKYLADLCERHNFKLYLQYGEGNDVWDIDINGKDGNNVYTSFICKGHLKDLIGSAVAAVEKYIVRKTIHPDLPEEGGQE